MAELAREEVAAQSQLLEDLARQLKVLLLPRDPLDERNIMLEVRCLVPWLHAVIGNGEAVPQLGCCMPRLSHD